MPELSPTPNTMWEHILGYNQTEKQQTRQIVVLYFINYTTAATCTVGYLLTSHIYKSQVQARHSSQTRARADHQ